MFEEPAKGIFAFCPANAGSNAYLIAAKKPVLVDCSAEFNSKEIVSGLAEIGFFPEGIGTVLLTHGHADHFSGCKPFKNAKFFMHTHDAKFVNAKDAEFTFFAGMGVREFPKVSEFKTKVLDFPPFRFEIIHTPGHTEGSVCFYEKRMGILFSGDTVFEGSCGRFDLQSGSRQELVNSLQSLKKLDFSLLLPGHGAIVSKAQKENLEAAIECAQSTSFI